MRITCENNLPVTVIMQKLLLISRPEIDQLLDLSITLTSTHGKIDG